MLGKPDNRIFIGCAAVSGNGGWQEGAIAAAWKQVKQVHERAMTTAQTATLAVLFAIGLSSPAAAQTAVAHIQTKEAGIASGVWVGDMLYLSGQLPTPVTPADRAKGTPAVYGNTEQQSLSTFTKIENLLKAQRLGMGDVVMMRVYMASDPAMEGKLDFAGMNAAYAKFFGTPEQPNKLARSTFQVAALVAAGALVEIEVQAARGK